MSYRWYFVAAGRLETYACVGGHQIGNLNLSKQDMLITDLVAPLSHNVDIFCVLILFESQLSICHLNVFLLFC